MTEEVLLSLFLYIFFLLLPALAPASGPLLLKEKRGAPGASVSQNGSSSFQEEDESLLDALVVASGPAGPAPGRGSGVGDEEQRQHRQWRRRGTFIFAAASQPSPASIAPPLWHGRRPPWEGPRGHSTQVKIRRNKERER